MKGELSLRLMRSLLVLLLVVFAWPATAATVLRLGVLATRPKVESMKRWQPVAKYLETALSMPVELGIYTHPELDALVAQHMVDVVLTSPGHFVMLKQSGSLSAPIATLISLEGAYQLTAFGGTIFTRAERSDIAALADLVGKNIAAVSLEAFGAYQMQAFEMLEAGLPLPHGKQLLFTGLPQDLVVEAVLSGRADVGFVRSGLLEALVQDGKLDMQGLRIVNRQNLPAYPYALSTRLYPEWPVSVMSQVDSHLATRLTVALLSLPHDNAALRAAGIHGFTTAANYDGVENMLRRMRQPPFDILPEFSLSDLWRKYRDWILALGVLALMLGGTAVTLVVQNRRLQRSRTQYRQSSQRLGELIWATNIGTWEWNVVTGETQFNARWAEIVGYTTEELAPIRGNVWGKLTHPDDLNLSRELMSRCLRREAETYECEIRMHHKNGHWVWVLDRGRVVEWSGDGKPVRVSGTHQDIDERKQAEVALQEKSEALQRSNADLEQFAYSVSHDMRQPLRAISGHLQLLDRAVKEQLDADNLENLRFALEGAKRMDAMIVSLLDYSRVGRLTSAKTSLASRDAVDEALGFLAPDIEEAAATVSVSGDWPGVFASRDELTRLLQNLIGNALKYRAEGIAPCIAVVSSVADGTWRVSVSDNGIGIDPQQSNRLFKFFSRLQSRTAYAGTGMGLAMCRRIVEHHDGRIWAESAGMGLGSSFIFEIPLKPTHQEKT